MLFNTPHIERLNHQLVGLLDNLSELIDRVSSTKFYFSGGIEEKEEIYIFRKVNYFFP